MPVLWKQKQEDLSETRLVYLSTEQVPGETGLLHTKTVSKKKKKKRKKLKQSVGGISPSPKLLTGTGPKHRIFEILIWKPTTAKNI